MICMPGRNRFAGRMTLPKETPAFSKIACKEFFNTRARVHEILRWLVTVRLRPLMPLDVPI